MEHKTRVLSPETLAGQLPGLLEEGTQVPLMISGNSMSPFLVHGRDTVYLAKADSPLKKGDMIFYRRDNGDYVLHRICSVEKESYTLIGDAQSFREPGIRNDQILARVTAVRRKGKLLRGGSFWWDFFEKIWIRMIPLRRSCLAVYTAASGIIRKRK